MDGALRALCAAVVRNYRWNCRLCWRHAGQTLTTSTALHVVPDDDDRRPGANLGAGHVTAAAADVDDDDDGVDDDDDDEFDGYDSPRPTLCPSWSALWSRGMPVLVAAQRWTNYAVIHKNAPL